jgi:replicative DNA helicase
MSRDEPQIRVPPHNLEAEEGLLASCLMPDGAGLDSLLLARAAGVNADDFYKTAHQEIYRVICEIEADTTTQAENFNAIELFERLKKKGLAEKVGGLATIYAIQDRVETASHAKYFARIVKEKSTARKTILACRLSIEDLYEQNEDPSLIAAKLESAMQSVSEEAIEDTLLPIKTVAERYTKTLLKRISGDKEDIRPICDTHLAELNEALPGNGFAEGDMIVLAARPSVGKTSLAMNFVDHCSVDEKGTKGRWLVPGQRWIQRKSTTRESARRANDGLLRRSRK